MRIAPTFFTRGRSAFSDQRRYSKIPLTAFFFFLVSGSVNADWTRDDIAHVREFWASRPSEARVAEYLEHLGVHVPELFAPQVFDALVGGLHGASPEVQKEVVGFIKLALLVSARPLDKPPVSPSFVATLEDLRKNPQTHHAALDLLVFASPLKKQIQTIEQVLSNPASDAQEVAIAGDRLLGIGSLRNGKTPLFEREVASLQAGLQKSTDPVRRAYAASVRGVLYGGQANQKQQRLEAELLQNPDLPEGLRSRIATSLLSHPLTDAQTLASLLTARDLPQNREVRGAIDKGLQQIPRTVGIGPEERPSLENQFAQLAEDRSKTAAVRERALAVLQSIGATEPAAKATLTRASRRDDGTKSLFSGLWLDANSNASAAASAIEHAEKNTEKARLLSGLVTVVSHPSPEVRAEAGKALIRLLKADTREAEALPSLELQHLREYALLADDPSSAFLLFRQADKKTKLQLLDIARQRGNIEASLMLHKAIALEPMSKDNMDDAFWPYVRNNLRQFLQNQGPSIEAIETLARASAIGFSKDWDVCSKGAMYILSHSTDPAVRRRAAIVMEQALPVTSPQEILELARLHRNESDSVAREKMGNILEASALFTPRGSPLEGAQFGEGLDLLSDAHESKAVRRALANVLPTQVASSQERLEQLRERLRSFQKTQKAAKAAPDLLIAQTLENAERTFAATPAPPSETPSKDPMGDRDLRGQDRLAPLTRPEQERGLRGRVGLYQGPRMPHEWKPCPFEPLVRRPWITPRRALVGLSIIPPAIALSWNHFVEHQHSKNLDGALAATSPTDADYLSAGTAMRKYALEEMFPQLDDPHAPVVHSYMGVKKQEEQKTPPDLQAVLHTYQRVIGEPFTAKMRELGLSEDVLDPKKTHEFSKQFAFSNVSLREAKAHKLDELLAFVLKWQTERLQENGNRKGKPNTLALSDGTAVDNLGDAAIRTLHGDEKIVALAPQDWSKLSRAQRQVDLQRYAHDMVLRRTREGFMPAEVISALGIYDHEVPGGLASLAEQAGIPKSVLLNNDRESRHYGSVNEEDFTLVEWLDKLPKNASRVSGILAAAVQWQLDRLSQNALKVNKQTDYYDSTGPVTIADASEAINYLRERSNHNVGPVYPPIEDYVSQKVLRADLEEAVGKTLFLDEMKILPALDHATKGKFATQVKKEGIPLDLSSAIKFKTSYDALTGDQKKKLSEVRKKALIDAAIAESKTEMGRYSSVDYIASGLRKLKPTEEFDREMYVIQAFEGVPDTFKQSRPFTILSDVKIDASELLKPAKESKSLEAITRQLAERGYKLTLSTKALETEGAKAMSPIYGKMGDHVGGFTYVNPKTGKFEVIMRDETTLLSLLSELRHVNNLENGVDIGLGKGAGPDQDLKAFAHTERDVHMATLEMAKEYGIELPDMEKLSMYVGVAAAYKRWQEDESRKAVSRAIANELSREANRPNGGPPMGYGGGYRPNGGMAGGGYINPNGGMGGGAYPGSGGGMPAGGMGGGGQFVPGASAPDPYGRGGGMPQGGQGPPGGGPNPNYPRSMGGPGQIDRRAGGGGFRGDVPQGGGYGSGSRASGIPQTMLSPAEAERMRRESQQVLEELKQRLQQRDMHEH